MPCAKEGGLQGASSGRSADDDNRLRSDCWRANKYEVKRIPDTYVKAGSPAYIVAALAGCDLSRPSRGSDGGGSANRTRGSREGELF